MEKIEVDKALLNVKEVCAYLGIGETKVRELLTKTGEGMEDFLETLEKILREDKQLLEGVFPYEQGNQIPPIRKYGELLKEEYREDGIYVKAYVPGDLYPNLAEHIR